VRTNDAKQKLQQTKISTKEQCGPAASWPIEQQLQAHHFHRSRQQAKRR
jgi:hypothetical protein